MFRKMLKLTMGICVFTALSVGPAILLSQSESELAKSFVDKKCGDPSTPERVLKRGSACSSNLIKQSCDNAKSPTYKVKKAPGCTVDAPQEGSYPDEIYFLCWENSEIVEHGKVSCKWTGPTTGGSCTNAGDWSITDKKFKNCKYESFRVEYRVN